MNKTKFFKALGLAMCAILLVVGSVAGTFAYLTSTATVTNTFTVGNVSITMTEAKVDLYGNVEIANRVTENEYKLSPGHTYTKDPTIYVGADSEECYVFFELENDLATIATLDINTNDWTQIGTTNVYYYKSTLSAGEQCTAFNTFEIAEDADVSAYVDAQGNVDAVINVTAYAIQADGFADAAAAWDAAPTAWKS